MHAAPYSEIGEVYPCSSWPPAGFSFVSSPRLGSPKKGTACIVCCMIDGLSCSLSPPRRCRRPLEAAFSKPQRGRLAFPLLNRAVFLRFIDCNPFQAGTSRLPACHAATWRGDLRSEPIRRDCTVRQVARSGREFGILGLVSLSGRDTCRAGYGSGLEISLQPVLAPAGPNHIILMKKPWLSVRATFNERWKMVSLTACLWATCRVH
jgi:hypothetical protein